MNINFAPVDENFIKLMVEYGCYTNATELVRDAVRRLREHSAGQERLLAALKLGEDDIAAGRVVPYTPTLLDEIGQEALERVVQGDTEYDPDVIP